MQRISIALMGFGNVGRAFARLLLKQQAFLREKYNLDIIVTGISTGSHGSAINSAGVNLNRALELADGGNSLQSLSERTDSLKGEDFIYACSAEFLLESTPLNPYTGQPALNYLKTALNRGMHVVTANKGPVVHGFTELNDLSQDYGKCFYYESAVMDGAPVFSVFREALPAIEVKSINGILNSCTNFLLDLMERGVSFTDAVRQAQKIGITETDPANDIDGWDASIKLAALVTVLMGIPLKPQDVDRTGIRDFDEKNLGEARELGGKWKLVCSAKRQGMRLLEAVVRPEIVKPDSPLYSILGTSSYVQFETDMLPGLGIVETDPGPETTAYGMLADLLNIYKKNNYG